VWGGATLGKGDQYISWIGMPDLCQVIDFIIENETLAGPVNAVSPNPVTNKTFTKVLGNRLKRPAVFTIPAFILSLFYGEMADEMILSSSRVIPAKLQESVYPFTNPTIKEAIETQIKGK